MKAILPIICILLLTACNTGVYVPDVVEESPILGTYAAVDDDFYFEFRDDGTAVMLNELGGYPQQLLQYEIEGDRLTLISNGQSSEVGLEIVGGGSGFILHSESGQDEYVRVN